MSLALNPALVAFIQIALALVLCYLCIVVIKIFRDATSTNGVVSPGTQQRVTRTAVTRGESTSTPSVSTLTRQQP